MSRVIALVKRGFDEVPHFMLGGGIFIFSVCGAIVTTRRHYKYERNRRQWKRRYTVVREEDFDPKKQVHSVDHKYPMF